MPRGFLRCLIAPLCLLTAHVVAQPTATPASNPASAAAAPHHASEHKTRQRNARLNHLVERLSNSSASLSQRCRFESEITTLPPKNLVALTFDDGPEPGQTELIVEVLKRQQVPATFFLIGEKAQRDPALVALIRSLPGVRIGNHSWTHPNFHQLDAAAQRQEMDRNDALLTSALPAGGVKLFRYPYGNSSCEGNLYAHALGYHIVGWHVDSCDWAFDDDGSVDGHEALSCGVLPPFHHDFLGHVLSATRAHQGGIVLLHETRPHTVAQLESLIEKLKAEKYEFTTPDDARFAATLR
jgi:peptidoglycan-N-acetylglucosamine deacetylase